MSTTEQIPQPKTYGPLAHLPLIDAAHPTLSMMKLAQEQGPIFRFQRPGGQGVIVVSGHEYAREVCDESRFDKSIKGPLENVRAFAGDGLFTANTNEPNWRKAHNILLANFSQRAMKRYHPMMVDIAVQLVQKWARLNPEETIDVPEDMTRLTLDTIGLCGFNYRFNSYYREQPHPFITSMVNALGEAMNMMQRLPIQDKMMVLTKRHFQQDIQSMFELVDRLIAERKNSGEDVDDLLSHMLNSKDPETGEGLDDENIRFQIITFLIAGHETTSGLLSFALYFLMKNPDVLKKAYEEVDRVMTHSIPTYQQVVELKYVRMVLNEALRLWPTAPGFSLFAKEDTLLGGKYPVAKEERVTVLLPQLHRDREAWGEDAEEFRPERFADPKQVPHHAFKPFGNGQRACIGQQFALHEATLVLGMVLKHFELIDHADYELKIKQTLTLKPEGLTMQVKPRIPIVSSLGTGAAVTAKKAKTETEFPEMMPHHTPLLVLYGSSLGTAEGVARGLSDAARELGFESEAAPLDEYVGKLPREGAVLITCASYNGRPPANARKFLRWLEEANAEDVQGVRYAVFGCGDKNWATTYQKIPRSIDQQLAEKGAIRITPLGDGDAGGDFDHQLEAWRQQLGRDLVKMFDLKVVR